MNKDLVNLISSVCGGKYCSANRPDELAELMSTDFAYDITMIAHDIKFEFDVNGYEAIKVYGTPEASDVKRNKIEISSEFPASSLKGGMYVFKLKKKKNAAKGNFSSSGTVKVTFRNGNGQRQQQVLAVSVPSAPSHGSKELRKAVSLINFIDVHNEFLGSSEDKNGMSSTPSEANKAVERYMAFRTHFISELEAVGDYTLATTNKGDLELLDKMIEIEAKDAGIPAPLLTAPSANPNANVDGASMDGVQPSAVTRDVKPIVGRNRKSQIARTKVQNIITANVGRAVNNHAGRKAKLLTPRRRSKRLEHSSLG